MNKAIGRPETNGFKPYFDSIYADVSGLFTNMIFNSSNKPRRKSGPLRYGILLAVSFMYFVVYYLYDLPSALSIPLQTHLTLTDSQYTYLLSSLYVAFAVPSIILPFQSGFAIQRYGSKTLLLCCLAALAGGQLSFCIAIQIKSAAGLVLSRVFLGMGGEVLGVLGTEIVTRWFPGEKLTLAMAIFSSISSLGTVANSTTTPSLVQVHGIAITTWLGSMSALGLVVLSAAFVLIVDVVEEFDEPGEKEAKYMESLYRLPRSYWYIAFICFSGYGCMLPFFNSAQRFIGSRFYADDQTVAGLAVSITHFLGGVLPMFLGVLLEISRLKNYSLALLYSCVLMFIPHVLFLVDYGGLIFPLCVLGTANALFITALWASISMSILQVPDPIRNLWELSPLSVEDQSPTGMESVLDDFSIAEMDERTLDSEGLLAQGFGQSLVLDSPQTNDDLVVIGYGIITSLMNASTAIVPFFLIIAEARAGYSGLETIFVILAVISTFVSLILVTKEKNLT